jgi:DNA-binding transcriptional MerR regulator
MKSSSLDVTLTIGETAARFDLAPHVLRHWESMGLVAPRRSGDRRRYDADDLYRIAMVITAKRGGMSLDDIRELYLAPDGGTRKEILRRHQSALRRRIAEMRAALDLIDHGVDCGAEDIVDCPHFRRNVSALVGPDPREPTNSSPVELSCVGHR